MVDQVAIVPSEAVRLASGRNVAIPIDRRREVRASSAGRRAVPVVAAAAGVAAVALAVDSTTIAAVLVVVAIVTAGDAAVEIRDDAAVGATKGCATRAVVPAGRATMTTTIGNEVRGQRTGSKRAASTTT